MITCNKFIAYSDTDEFYHCNLVEIYVINVMKIKKQKFYDNIKRAEKALLFIGKREVFKKDLEKTKEFIKNKKFKLKRLNIINCLKLKIKIYLSYRGMIIYVRFVMIR